MPSNVSPVGSCLVVLTAVRLPFTYTDESGSSARPLEMELGTQCMRFSVSRNLGLNG